jgi:acetylornithine deacetylase/succinyl-diaminopimelate desuccinylase-like protein
MTEGLLSKLDDSYALRRLEEMIAINSVVGQEGELAEYLRGELEALGLRCEVEEVEPGRPNVYARFRHHSGGRGLGD